MGLNITKGCGNNPATETTEVCENKIEFLTFTKEEIDEFKTKQDLEQIIKFPHKIYKKSDGFFARSYQEDCFLAGGGRIAYTERFEWKDDSNYLVIYLKDDQIIRKF